MNTTRRTDPSRASPPGPQSTAESQAGPGPGAGARLSTQIFRELFERASEAILVYDAGGRILLANAQAERFTGFRRDELVGAPVEALIPERLRAEHRERRDRYFVSRAARPMGAGFDFTLRHRDGHEIPVEISLNPLGACRNRLVAASIRDATDRMRTLQALETERERAEAASRSKTELLAGASHDLRQPLQAARFQLEIARLRPDTPGVLDRVDSSLGSLAVLLERLLGVSRLDAGAVVPSPRRFGLEQVFDRLLSDLGPSAGAKGIELRHVPSDAVVESDPDLLYEVLQNLLSNAIRYTAEGRVLLGCRRRGGAVAVQVLDTGPGIPEDQFEKIFRPFYRGRRPAGDASGGIGLGLAIVQRLARLLRHEVRVRSTVGRGTLFEVIVPRAGSPVRARRGDAGR